MKPRIISLLCVLLVLQLDVSKPDFSHAHSHSASAIFNIFLPYVTSDVEINNKDNSEESPLLGSWGAPIAVTSSGNAIWTVNPDSGTVTVVSSKTLTTVTEISIGQDPWSVVIAPSNKFVYVTDRALGTLVQIDATSYQVIKTLYVGPELGMVALSPSGQKAYVTVMAANEVVEVDLPKFQVINRVSVPYMPYAIGVTNDGDMEVQDEKIVVTHLFALQTDGGIEATDSGRTGRLSILDASLNIIAGPRLPADETGFPNLLAAVAMRGEKIWIPTIRAAPDLPNSLTKIVFSAISTLDLNGIADAAKNSVGYIPLNDMDIFGSPVNNPIASIPSLDGSMLYVVLAGSDLVEIVDISDSELPRLDGFLRTGSNPRGMALSPDGQVGYVMNYLSRSISVLDLVEKRVITEIPVTEEPLSDAVLQGKTLFNNAVNPKLSQGSWISCASCHPDGGTDSVTWMFPDGPRQTPPIWNAIDTLPWHWSAALDEPHDVEETIHLIQFGLGLAPSTDPAQLGTPNAGRSDELDALVAFMQSGIRIPTTAAQNDNAQDSGMIKAGRALFISAGCAECHGGPNWTRSTLTGPAGTLDEDGNGMIDALLHDVGTFNERDVRGAAGFDTPALLNLRLTAPYLHDGSAQTLHQLLTSGHPTPADHQHHFSEDELQHLVVFLNQITTTTKPLP